MDEVDLQLSVKLEEKHSELVKIVQSFENLEKSKEWEVLRELVFSRELASIERQLLVAALVTPLDQAKIYRLQGERMQAKKYDLPKYIESLKRQLEEINKKLK